MCICISNYKCIVQRCIIRELFYHMQNNAVSYKCCNILHNTIIALYNIILQDYKYNFVPHIIHFLILHHMIHNSIIPYYIIKYIIVHDTMWHHMIQYDIIIYNIVPYKLMQNHIILYNIVVWFIVIVARHNGSTLKQFKYIILNLIRTLFSTIWEIKLKNCAHGDFRAVKYKKKSIKLCFTS